MLKQTVVIIFLTALFLPLISRTIDLYYTEDGKTIKSIRGYNINNDLTIVDEGNQSWLFAAGYKIGPNGFIAKPSKLSIGSLGKNKDTFVISRTNFLGFGKAKKFERDITWDEIAFILPNPEPFAPVKVFLFDGSDGELFVRKDYTESIGEKTIGNIKQNYITVVKLQYSTPVHRRSASTRPRQLGFHVKALAFSESGLRQALRKMRYR